MANTYIDKGQLEAVEMWFRRMQRMSWESDIMNTSLNLSDKQTTHETDDCHVVATIQGKFNIVQPINRQIGPVIFEMCYCIIH